MKAIKRVLSVCLIISMLLGMTLVPVSAESTLNFSMRMTSKATGASGTTISTVSPGDTFFIFVSFDGNTKEDNMASCGIVLEYDPSVISVTAMAKRAPASELGLAEVNATYEDNRVLFGWANTTGMLKSEEVEDPDTGDISVVETFYDSGELFRVTCKVNDTITEPVDTFFNIVTTGDDALTVTDTNAVEMAYTYQNLSIPVVLKNTISISGDAEIAVPLADGAELGSVEKQYTVSLTDDNAETVVSPVVTWSIVDKATGSTVSGVSVDDYGTVKVVSNAPAGVYSLTASATQADNASLGVDSVSATKEITVTRAASQAARVEVAPVSAQLARPEYGADAVTQQFAATVYDQYGAEMTGETVTWSTNAGEISDTGLLTIPNAVLKGSYEVKATIGNVFGTAAVNVTEADRVAQSITLYWDDQSEITGPVNLAAPATGTYTGTCYAEVVNQYGDTMDPSLVTWSYEIVSGSGVTVSNNQITIPAGCGDAVVELTASCGGKEASVTINIEDIDFEAEGDKFYTLNDDTAYGKTWGEYVTIGNITAMLGSDPVGGEYTLSVDSTAVPTAGTYNISILFNGGDYEDVVVATFEYTVTKVEVAVPEAESGLVYTAETKTGVADGENYSVAEGTAVNAGSYTATVSLDNTTNYQWADGTTADKNVSWSIAAAPLSLGQVVVDDKTYDAAHDATVDSVEFVGLQGNDTLTADTDYTVTAAFDSADAGDSVAASGTVTLLDSVKAKNYTLADGAFATTAKIEASDSFTDATKTIQNVVVEVGTFTAPSFTGIGDEAVEGTVAYTYNNETKTKTEIETALAALNEGDTASIGYSFEASGNYSGTKSGTITVKMVYIEFKVGEADATVDNAVTIKADPTYGDTWDDIVTLKTIAASVDGVPVEGTFTLQETGTRPNANEQTYHVIFNGGRYTDVEVFSGTVTIAKKAVDVVWGDASFTYNGAEQAPAASIADADLVGEDVVDLIVDGKQTNASADAYTATAGTTNTNYELGNTTKNFTIAPKSVAVEWGSNELTYNGAEQAPTATVNTGIEGETLVPEVAGAAKNAGSHTATASTTNTNYTLTNTEKAFTIAPKSVTITGIGAANKVYDGNTAAEITGTAVVNGKIEGDDVTVNVSEATAVFADKNVGTGKTVTFRGFVLDGVDKVNYQTTQPASVTADITAKPLAVVWSNFEGLTFTGAAQLPDADVETDVAGETLTVTVTGAGTNVGTYTATAAIADTNYTLTGATKEFSIAKAAAPTLGVDGTVTYKYTITGEKTVTITGVAGNAGTVDYTVGTVTGQTSILDGTPTIDDATGVLTFVLAADVDDVDKTVTIPVSVAMQNYADASCNVVITIKFKDVPAAAAKDITVDYTGSALTADAIVTDGEVTFEGQTVEGAWVWVTAPATMVTAGTYSADVKFVPTDDTNYAEVEDTITVKINKIKVTVPTAVAGLVYTGEALTGVVDGDYYSVADNTATNAGDYTATVTLDDADNYEWGTECTGSIAWAIAKATPTGTPEYKTLTAGKKLSDAELAVGTLTPAGGTIKWVDNEGNELPADTDVTANTGYKWQYTPVDTANYNVLTGTIVLYRVSSGGGGASTPTTDVTENPDGSTTTTTKDSTGSVGETTVAADGTVSAEVDLSKSAVSQANRKDEAVELPIEELPVVSETEKAPTVTINTGAKEPVKVKVPVAEATAGTVAILVKEDGTQQVVRDSVVDSEGVTLEVEDGAQIIVVDNSKDFTDLPETHWASDAVDFVGSRELFSGVGNDKFAPNMPTNRAMIAQVLHTLSYNPKATAQDPFHDVNEGDWHSEAVAWAAETGVVSGYGNGVFAPYDNITREQLVVMLWSFSGRDKAAHSRFVNTFGDKDAVSAWALDAMNWALENKILGGKGDDVLDPIGLATRAEVAQMIKNFCGYLAK